MMHRLTFYSTLLIVLLGMPIAAQASCIGYQNDTFTLQMPATITVPDSLPVGSVIARQAFNGSAPAISRTCLLASTWTAGRYSANNDSNGAYPTGVPGVSLAVKVTTAHQGPVNTPLHPTPLRVVTGKFPNYTSAEAIFYKTGAITSGTVPAGTLFENKWQKSSNTFRLQIGSPIRFVRPAATCNLATGDVNRTITLPTIRASDLRDVLVAGRRDFDLSANCSNASNVTFRFTGTPAPGNNQLFANTGTARGVALLLYSRINGVPQTITNNDTRATTVSGNRAVLPLGAAYYKNGTVGAGTLVSTATVNITYN